MSMTYKELIETEGGFSRDILGNWPLTGYIVSLPGYTRRIVLENFSDENVKDYAASYFYELTSPGSFFIGGWVENDEVWLDVSENIQSLVEAKLLGVERNQIAIWDVVNSCEIPTGGTGE